MYIHVFPIVYWKFSIFTRTHSWESVRPLAYIRRFGAETSELGITVGERTFLVKETGHGRANTLAHLLRMRSPPVDHRANVHQPAHPAELSQRPYLRNTFACACSLAAAVAETFTFLLHSPNESIIGRLYELRMAIGISRMNWPEMATVLNEKGSEKDATAIPLLMSAAFFDFTLRGSLTSNFYETNKHAHHYSKRRVFSYFSTSSAFWKTLQIVIFIVF